jgi:hypothetical protein
MGERFEPLKSIDNGFPYSTERETAPTDAWSVRARVMPRNDFRPTD